jgi:signal transduction histidine kinase
MNWFARLRALFRFRKLTQQLTWLFLFLVGTVLALFGILAYTLSSTSLESELGRHLVAVARLKALAVPPGLIISVLPGGRAAERLRIKAAELAREAGVEAVQVMRADGVVLADTLERANEGRPYAYLALDSTEWELALNGDSRATPLFVGRGGRHFKSAYAPILNEGKVIAVARVEASADFLSEVRRFGTSMLVLGLLSLVFAVAIAAFVSRPIVSPVQDLIAASRRIARGDFGARVEVRRQDEIGQMSATFNEMAEQLGAFVGERERLATLGELAAGVVHEVRNPLAAIEGFATLVETRLKPKDPSRAYTRDIKNEVRIVNGFLTDFLEYAKPRQPRLEAIHPAEVADAALAVVLPGDRARRWKPSWGRRDPVRVLADKDQLRQVFVNLLMNAREASPKGGPLILSCLRRGAEARLSVVDKGKGISKADLEKLFTPFFTSKPMGTGLGLSIAGKIVESFGGRIEVESEEGKGSNFTVILPIIQ